MFSNLERYFFSSGAYKFRFASLSLFTFLFTQLTMLPCKRFLFFPAVNFYIKFEKVWIVSCLRRSKWLARYCSAQNVLTDMKLKSPLSPASGHFYIWPKPKDAKKTTHQYLLPNVKHDNHQVQWLLLLFQHSKIEILYTLTSLTSDACNHQTFRGEQTRKWISSSIWNNELYFATYCIT